MAAYIISIDQSTQGTKALLFDETGTIVRRTDCAHRQIVNEKGWVSHDPEEIYRNVLTVVSKLLEGIDANCVVGVGISNQRETTVAWNKIHWQAIRKCSGMAVCESNKDLRARVHRADGRCDTKKDGNESITVFSGCKAYMDSRK